MKNENLLIIFAKNSVPGKVKTRLAQSHGDAFAFEVYERLVGITEKESLLLSNTDIHVYFSDTITESPWSNQKKFVQKGTDLGERMKNAFEQGFSMGYQRIIGIGTDLPDLDAKIMSEALSKLESTDTVFGPSEDGGYYLIGMRKMIPEIFDNKPWSTDSLLRITLDELISLHFSTSQLEPLNDIDTIDDLKSSWLGKEFSV